MVQPVSQRIHGTARYGRCRGLLERFPRPAFFPALLLLALLPAACLRIPEKPPTPPGKQVFMEPPAASEKDMAAQVYDIEHPCMTRGMADRAREVLFVDYRHTDEPRWIGTLNRVLLALNADCADEDFLLLVLSVTQMESGVNVDPPIERPNLERMFALKLEAMAESNQLLGRLVGATELEADIRDKLRADTRRRVVKTEGDLVRYFANDLRPWLAGYLSENYGLPDGVARRVAEAGLPNPVRTIGPMQVNVDKAYRNALQRGEHIDSAEEMLARLLDPGTALQRGLKEGVFLLLQPYRFYRRYLDPPEAVLLAAADYNGGEFSSRNAAFQERVALLSGRSLVLDGDLLVYDDGAPADRLSNTELAINAILPQTAVEIRSDLMLEKEPDFWTSETAEAICRRFKARTGKMCTVGRLPAGAANASAALKHGRAYTPVEYARRAYERHQANRRLFDKLGPAYVRVDPGRADDRSDTDPH